MTTIPRDFLPVAAPQAPPTVPALTACRNAAWQLAMEKAQTREWFHGTVGQGAAPQLGGQAAAEGHQAVLSGQVTATASPSLRPAVGMPAPRSQEERVSSVNSLETWKPEALSSTSSFGGLSGTGVPAARSSVSVVRAAVLCQADSPGVPASRRSTTVTESLRVHVEEGPQGLRIWFGMDGEAAAVTARAQAVLADLRQGFTGPRLALVVCNGATLFQREPPGIFPNARPLYSPFPSHSQEP